MAPWRVLVFLVGLSAFGLIGLRPGGSTAQDLSETLETCIGCHGGDSGVPEDPEVPIIWGQHFYYLYVQLKDYKAGRRSHEVMTGMVAELTKEQMQALAKHFSEKPWPKTGYRAEAQDIAAGRTASSAGQCVQCHLGGYEGNSRVPRLAGQTASYLERTMSEFKHKQRTNSPAKSSLMASYEEADIVALARFLAGF